MVKVLTRSGIYGIFRIGSAECYIGQTVDFSRRWKTHRQDFKNNRHASKFMQRVYNKHGLEAFEFKILQFVDDISKLNKAETKWIKLHNPCYNSAPVAGSCLGYKHSDITREKHRQLMLGNTINKGRPSHRRGVKMSEETKRKISIAKTGKPGPRLGIRHTPESIEKMSRNRRGISSKFKGISYGAGIPWSEARWEAQRKRKERLSCQIR